MQTVKSPLDRAIDAVALIGLAAWLVLLAVLHLITSTDISTDAISLYAIGDFGYLMAAAFVGLGLAHLALATRLRRHLGLRLGPSLLVLVGVSTLGSAVFATDPMNAETMSTHGTIHVLLGLVAFIVMALTPVVFAASLRRIPGWRRMTWASLGLGCATLAAFLAMPLIFKDAFFGVGQRLFAAIYLAWLTTMTLSVARLHSARVDRSGARDSQPSPIGP